MLAKEKANLDRIFGPELQDPLTIEIYNDSAAIKEVSPGAVGYYKRRNQSIHLMKMDDEKDGNVSYYMNIPIIVFTNLPRSMD